MPIAAALWMKASAWGMAPVRARAATEVALATGLVPGVAGLVGAWYFCARFSRLRSRRHAPSPLARSCTSTASRETLVCAVCDASGCRVWAYSFATLEFVDRALEGRSIAECQAIDARSLVVRGIFDGALGRLLIDLQTAAR